MAHDQTQLVRNRTTGLRPSTVLVLDDDQFDRKRIARWIDKAAAGPVRLVECPDLGQFETLLRNETFDLIVIDFVLADGTGHDALRMLAKSGLNASAYAVIVSGKMDPTIAPQAKALGCDRFLSKDSLSVTSVTEILHESRLFSPAEHFKIAVPGGSIIDQLANRARRRVNRNQISVPPRAASPTAKKLKMEIGFASVKDPDFLGEFFQADEFDFKFRPK